MDRALHLGAAIFNAGAYHAAHDAWEDHWLDLEAGTPDERLLHGLIQYSAIIHHVYNRNWAGAQGLAGSAVGYLANLGPSYRSVEIDPILAFLRHLHRDPEVGERRPIPPLEIDGEIITIDALSGTEAARAAHIVAGDLGTESDVFERAYKIISTQQTRPPEIPSLCRGYVRDPSARSVIIERLETILDRYESRGVEGLF